MTVEALLAKINAVISPLDPTLSIENHCEFARVRNLLLKAQGPRLAAHAWFYKDQSFEAGQNTTSCFEWVNIHIDAVLCSFAVPNAVSTLICGYLVNRANSAFHVSPTQERRLLGPEIEYPVLETIFIRPFLFHLVHDPRGPRLVITKGGVRVFTKELWHSPIGSRPTRLAPIFMATSNYFVFIALPGVIRVFSTEPPFDAKLRSIVIPSGIDVHETIAFQVGPDGQFRFSQNSSK